MIAPLAKFTRFTKFAMLPILVNLRDRPSLVVGAGPVGLRKCRAVLDAGGRVRLVAPRRPAEAIPDGVHLLQEPYRADHLDGVLLAFAAATPEVNERVVLDAAARGILVASASDPDSGDFALPATHRRGELTLAVSTGGASPYLAATIRDRLAAQFDEPFAAWLRVLRELREAVRTRFDDPSVRRELLLQSSDFRWLERFREAGESAARGELFALVESRAKR